MERLGRPAFPIGQILLQRCGHQFEHRLVTDLSGGIRELLTFQPDAFVRFQIIERGQKQFM